jgi:hypothetical protein
MIASLLPILAAAALFVTLTTAAPAPDGTDGSHSHGIDYSHYSLYGDSPPIAQFAGYALRTNGNLQQQSMAAKKKIAGRPKARASPYPNDKKDNLNRAERSSMIFRMVVESAYPKDASLEQWKKNRSELATEYGRPQYRENVQHYLRDQAKLTGPEKKDGDDFAIMRNNFLKEDF